MQNISMMDLHYNLNELWNRSVVSCQMNFHPHNRWWSR